MRKVFDILEETKIPVAIQVAVILFLIYLSLMPVEIRWTKSDLLLISMLLPISALGGFLLFFRREKFYITVADLLLMVFALYYGLHSLFGTEYPCGTQCLKVVSAFLLYISLRMLFSAQQMSQLAIVAFLLFCASIETLWGIFQLFGMESRSLVYMITGNFLNPGPYSAYLAIGIVTGLTLLVEKGRNILVFVVVLLMLIVLPSTWSRSAFIGVAIPILWLFRDRYFKYRFVVWGLIAVVAVVVYFTKKGSADGRLVIWIATLLSWRHCPLMGCGTGSFVNVYSEGIAEMYNNKIIPSILDVAGVTDNSFNFFLKILVEQGAVGLILFSVIIIVLMKGLYSSSRPLFFGMLTLLIFSMFSYPFGLLPYKILVVTTIAWSESRRNSPFPSSDIVNIAIMTFIIVGCVMIRKELVERYRADEEAKIISNQKSADFIDDYYELYPFEKENPLFLYDFAMTLNQDKQFCESNKILSNGCLVSSDPMFYVIMGNNFVSMNQPIQAEKSYIKAFSVMPNRILPLYRLMQLYTETGQCDRAKIIAEQIIMINPKVKSPATEEMKKNASKIIDEI